MRNSIGFPEGRRACFPLLFIMFLGLCTLLLAVGCGSFPSAKLTPEEMIEEKDEWADAIVDAALGNLVADGVIAAPNDDPGDDEVTLVERFEFERGTSGYDVAFEDREAGEELTGEYVLPQGKVILSGFDLDTSVKYSSTTRYRAYPEYAEESWANDEAGEDVPLFYPESLRGSFGFDGVKAILANVPADAFADSFEECDYLIVYDSGASHVSEDYYIGGVDRTSVTTLVFVIDSHENRVVHIENVGTDTPGSSIKLGQERGSMLWDECEAYLNTLLTNRPKG